MILLDPDCLSPNRGSMWGDGKDLKMEKKLPYINSSTDRFASPHLRLTFHQPLQSATRVRHNSSFSSRLIKRGDMIYNGEGRHELDESRLEVK